MPGQGDDQHDDLDEGDPQNGGNARREKRNAPAIEPGGLASKQVMTEIRRVPKGTHVGAQLGAESTISLIGKQPQQTAPDKDRRNDKQQARYRARQRRACGGGKRSQA